MRVDHIGLSVGDLDAQRDWYVAAFGFTTAKSFEVPAAGLRGVFLVGPDDLAIELLEKQGSARSATMPTSPPEALLHRGWAHLCFRVDDVAGAFARLVDRGAGVVSAPAPSPEPGSTFAFVTDPEGNLIELLDRDGPVRP